KSRTSCVTSLAVAVSSALMEMALAVAGAFPDCAIAPALITGNNAATANNFRPRRFMYFMDRFASEICRPCGGSDFFLLTQDSPLVPLCGIMPRLRRFALSQDPYAHLVPFLGCPITRSPDLLYAAPTSWIR